jgi:DMSO/TMAO reductase YedYZ molybdopterin-dependent catalytic subunit
MKRQRFLLPLVFLALLLMPLFSEAQVESTPHVSVTGEVLKPLHLSLEDLKQMKAHEVKTKDMQGAEHTFKGVRLVDILDSAGVTLGKELRGENLTKSLLLTAADGYQVTYALAEIDPEFTRGMILLAYEVDGQPLPSGDGPFRIIAPGDKRPARWIRELTSIKVLFPKD